MDMTLPFQIQQLSKNKRQTSQKAKIIKIHVYNDYQTTIPNNFFNFEDNG